MGGKELAGELKILENGRGRDEQDARELGFFNVQGTFFHRNTGREKRNTLKREKFAVVSWQLSGRGRAISSEKH
ncbi:MAG: hypothetical protein WCL71_14030 [Deltaproteobacteria bacterium]